MINFLKYNWIYFGISGIVIVIGLISILTGGLRYSIEFTGGTTLSYQLNRPLSNGAIAQVMKDNGLDVVELKVQGMVMNAQVKAIDEKMEAKFKKDIESKLSTKIEVLKSETIGPTLGRETLMKTLIAAGIAIVGILLYMSYTFKGFNFALAAILALVHDFLVLIGVYSLLCRFFGAQVDTLFVTAVLTTMSFSVHDTIIVFDKIREYVRATGRSNIVHYANRALTETLVRSLNNSMTVIFMLLALSLLGGDTIRFFVMALLVGTVSGTYSSPFVATPLLVWLEKMKKK